MYVPAYKQLFWGFLIVIVNIRIHEFDLLVDFIGYALLSSGLRKLSSVHPGYTKARSYSFILLFLSLFSVVQIDSGINGSLVFRPQQIFWLIGGELLSLLQFFLLYWICMAMIATAQRKSLSLFALQIRKRWNYYCGVFLLVFFATPFLLHVSDRWFPLYAALLVFAFIGLLLLSVTFRRAIHQLGHDHHC